jgi:cytochrome bd-type quinol oxidase subunit 1
VTYWSFRLMIGYGLLAAALLALADLWMTRQRIPHSRWFYRAAILALPHLTEMGRHHGRCSVCCRPRRASVQASRAEPSSPR